MDIILSPSQVFDGEPRTPEPFRVKERNRTGSIGLVLHSFGDGGSILIKNRRL